VNQHAPVMAGKGNTYYKSKHQNAVTGQPPFLHLLAAAKADNCCQDSDNKGSDSQVFVDSDDIQVLAPVVPVPASNKPVITTGRAETAARTRQNIPALLKISLRLASHRRSAKAAQRARAMGKCIITT